LVWECSQGAVSQSSTARGTSTWPTWSNRPGEAIRVFRRQAEAPGRAEFRGGGPRDVGDELVYGSILKFRRTAGRSGTDRSSSATPRTAGRGSPGSAHLRRTCWPTQAENERAYRRPDPRRRAGAGRAVEPVRLLAADPSAHGGSDTCMCEGSKFDVDEYGRVFYPNLNQFRVEMLDTNGNLIGTFGGYGNVDSGLGLGSWVPGKRLPPPIRIQDPITKTQDPFPWLANLRGGLRHPRLRGRYAEPAGGQGEVRLRRGGDVPGRTVTGFLPTD